MKRVLLASMFIFFLFIGCMNSGSGKVREIIIFHAGSLSVPFKQLKNEYEKSVPGIKILLEPAGSLVCARKITELKKPCDIIASADYFVIDELLIPDYTNWSIRFATNEMVVAYHEKSKYSSEINADNWFDILLRDDVIYSRSDPDCDPGGYRAILTMMLAEKYYQREGLTEKMKSKNKEYIRPKEVDLIALIESNAIDYMFQYKSVAFQHGLDYIELPNEINLSDPSKSDLYKTVFTDVTGSKPEEKIRITGACINYSLTLIDNAPQRDEAIDFLCYMLSDEGLEIFRRNGQNPLVPFTTSRVNNIPSKLLSLLPDYNLK